MVEKGLVSNMEVGLMTASRSEAPFGEKPEKSLGEGKREENVGLLLLAVGDGRQVSSDMRPWLLLNALDLLLRVMSCSFDLRSMERELGWLGNPPQ